eukprot:5338699-Ditylum_brightwellii.AAC.1
MSDNDTTCVQEILHAKVEDLYQFKDMQEIIFMHQSMAQYLGAIFQERRQDSNTNCNNKCQPVDKVLYKGANST